MNRLNLSVIALATTLFASATFADDETYVTQHYSFSLDDIDEVYIDGGIGEMEVIHSDGDEINIELEIEGKRRFWIMNKRDISDLELVQSKRGDTLRISLNEDDIEHVDIHWRIELPSVAHTHFNLGVGKITGEFADTELELDIGVGAADIAIARNGAGRVETSAGVGSAELHGASNVVNKRVMISEETYGYGEGKHHMELNVGVGEVKVRLTDNALVSF